MSGAPDLLYMRARAALLDAAEALAEQLDAVVLVGAQAIYIHTGVRQGPPGDPGSPRSLSSPLVFRPNWAAAS